MNRYAITVNNWEQVDVTNLFGMPYDYIIVSSNKLAKVYLTYKFTWRL